MQALQYIKGYGTVEVTSDLRHQLRDMIQGSGLTHKRIAEIANVHHQTISRYAALETPSPQLLKVAAVAEACGYSLTFVPNLSQRKH